MNNIHMVTGVSTWWDVKHGGAFPQRLFNSGACTCGSNCYPSNACIDLCNVLLNSNGLLPGYGCLAGSDLVLNLNLP
jgi:hypothetical protein